jgi:hypothetical protein
MKEKTNMKNNPIKIPYLFGEAYELANYIGMLMVVKSIKGKKNVNLLANGDIYEPVRVDPSLFQDLETQIHSMYDSSFENMKELILTLRPLEETIFLEDQISLFYSQLQEIGQIILKRTKDARSNFIRISEEESANLQDELINGTNGVNLILELISGFNDGQTFVEWCLHKFNDSFSIAVECSLFNQSNPDSAPKKPDIMVIQNQNVVLIGDIKSYIPFIRQNKTNRLKDALNQIPLEGLGCAMIEDSTFIPESLPLDQFVRRYNLLTRYFKVLKYVKIIYENGNDEFRNNPLFGIVVLPGKSILLHFENFADFSLMKNTLLKTIPFKINNFNDKSVYNIQEKLIKQYQIDLEYDLLSGDRYISTNQKEAKFIIKNTFYNRPVEQEIILGNVPKFERTEEIKTDIESPTNLGWKGESVHHIRILHLNDLITNLKTQNNKFQLLVDGSDQGTGKNYSFAKYIEWLQLNQKKKSILMVGPRKDTLVETIISICKNIGLPSPDINTKGGLNQTEFIHNTVKIRIIQSEFGRKVVFNQQGWINQKILYRGDSATRKLNNLIKIPNEGIEITFLTAQTLPFYFRIGKRSKNPFLHFIKFFKRFDLIVFDELTNSPPLVRETFIDLMIGYLHVKSQIPTIFPRILLLDASITSPQLLYNQIEPFFSQNEKFSPFSEYIQNKTDNPIEYNVDINGIEMKYFRYQLNQSLAFGISSIGWQKSFIHLPFEEIKQQIDKQLLLLQQKFWPDFPTFEELLKNGEVLFFIDNKALIEEFYEWLDGLGYKCGISIAEQKDRLSYTSKNILGTNSLAFGTSFPSKRLMIIVPPFKGTDYFQFRQNIELLRQVTKRMRGSEGNINRMVSFLVFPTENNDLSLANSVFLNFYKTRNCIREFLYQKKYHQLPSFSSYINKKSGINPNIPTSLKNTSIYIPKIPSRDSDGSNSISLEDFLGSIFPKLRLMLLKWGFRCNTSFKIGFDNKKLIRLPLSNFICYTLNNKDFSRTFHLQVYPSKSVQGLDKLISFLKRSFNEIKEDLAFFYNMCFRHDIQEKNPSLAAFKLLQGQIQKIKRNNTNKNSYLRSMADFIQHSVNIKSLPLSGTAYLLTLNTAEKTSLTVGKNLNIYQQISYQNREYINHLFKLTSPLKSLYFGAGNYFEQPVLVNFEKKGITTVGYLCYYPNFSDFDFSQPNYQLLKYCLLKELYRENYVYLPNLLKGSIL